MNAAVLAALIALTNGLGRVEIDTVGAHVMSYVPAGGEEVLFRTQAPRRLPDFYHGGIPVCWPWFNLQGDPGTIRHGFARTLEWEVVSTENGPKLSAATFRLRSGSESRRHFDGDFELLYTVTLADALTVDLTMRNTGARRFPVTTGFHSYFRIGDLAKTVVRLPDDLVSCTPGMDGARPYGAGAYALVDETTGRTVEIESWGNGKLVIWNVGKKPHPCFSADEWRRYVCVEPAIIPRGEGIWLEPQATYALGMRIRVAGK